MHIPNSVECQEVSESQPNCMYRCRSVKVFRVLRLGLLPSLKEVDLVDQNPEDQGTSLLQCHSWWIRRGSKSIISRVARFVSWLLNPSFQAILGPCRLFPPIFFFIRGLTSPNIMDPQFSNMCKKEPLCLAQTLHMMRYPSFLPSKIYTIGTLLKTQLMPTLYTTWGQLEHRPNSCVIKPSFRFNFIKFCGPNLVTCKVMRSDFRFVCSWGESLVKKIYPLWTDAIYVHYPVNEYDPGPCWEFRPRKSSSQFLQADPKVWHQNCAT